MTTMASQITSLTIVYLTVYSDADQRKHQSSTSLVFVWGIHRDRWIPRTKGKSRGKCFHLMTSSWLIYSIKVILWIIMMLDSTLFPFVGCYCSTLWIDSTICFIYKKLCIISWYCNAIAWYINTVFGSQAYFHSTKSISFQTSVVVLFYSMDGLS